MSQITSVGKICSQAYPCVQMADDRSVQFLTFNFALRTFDYNCLAEGLNKSVTEISSFVKTYLDPCLAEFVRNSWTMLPLEWINMMK